MGSNAHYGEINCRWGNVLFGHGFDKLIYVLFYGGEMQNLNCPRLEMAT